MSKTIDNKVVSLEFDNSKYDKRVDQSIKTTDKLKSSLEFKDVEKGFNKLNAAIKKVTFAPMEQSIDSVYAKFTAMERFMIQFYDRISNRIIDITKKTVSEITTVPVKTGWNEYEQKMDAIQVMMNSSGESLETVNKYLEELNKYADDTIYSFSDMTNNIGKFTNAGVKLEDAVVAIKGVSNAAALAGANSEQASRAMYNLSQALGMGYVAVRDWVSIENASMATVEFKNQLIAAGEAMGTLTKNADGTLTTMKGNVVTANNFRERLQDQWLTTDVLIEALRNYGDASTEIGKKAQKAATEVRTFTKMMDALKEALQSGWSASWELIIGNMEEAKALWTSINDVLSGLIGKMADARNGMLKVWKETGGRTAALEGFAQAWRNITSVLGAIRDAFRDVFPPMTGDRLREISILFEKLMRKLKPSPDTLDKIRRAFRGFFSILGIVSDAVKAFAKAMVPVISAIWKGRAGVLDSSAALGDWLTKLRATIKEGKLFETVFGYLSKGLVTAVNAIKMIASYIKDVIVAFKEKGFTGAFEVISAGFTALWVHIKSVLNFDEIKNKVKESGSGIIKTIEGWPIIGTITKIIIGIKNVFVNSGIGKFVTGIFVKMYEGVKSVIDKFRDMDTSSVGDFGDNIKSKFKSITDAFSGVTHFITSFLKFAGKAIKLIGTVAGTLFDVIGSAFDTLSEGIKLPEISMGEAGLAFAGGSLGMLLLQMYKLVKNFSAVIGDIRGITDGVAACFGSLARAINAEALKKIATSIAILAGSLVVLSLIPVEKLSAATAIITTLFMNLASIMKKYMSASSGVSRMAIGRAGIVSEGPGSAIASMGFQLFAIASAVAILVGAMAVISLLDYDSLVKGVGVILLLMKAVASIAKSMAKGERTSKISGGGAESFYREDTSLKMAGTLIAIGVSITMIVNAMVVLLYSIALLHKFAGSNTEKYILEAGSIVVGILLAVGLLVKTVSKSVATVQTQEESMKASAGMLIVILGVTIMVNSIIAAVTFLMITLAAMTKFGNGVAEASIISAMGIITTVFILIIALVAVIGKVITNLSESQGVKGVSTGKLLAILGTLSAFVLVVGLIIAEVMIVATVLAGVDAATDTLGSVTKLIEVLFGGIAALMFALGYYTNVKAQDQFMNDKKKTGIAGFIKNLATVILGITVAITALALACYMLDKVKWSALGKGAALLGGLIVVLIGVAALVGKVKTIQTGLNSMSGLFIGLAVGIGAVAASFLGFIVALKLLSSMSEEEMDTAIANMRKLLKTIKDLAPEIGVAVGYIVEMMIMAILSSIVKSWTTMLEEVFSALLNTLKELVKYGPEILRYIFDLVGIILDGIAARAPEITGKLVVALIAVVNGVANAIDEHREEILDAIDRVFDAIGKLVTSAIGRLVGKTGKDLEQFVDRWGSAMGKILKLVTAVFVALKAYAGLKTMFTALKAAKASVLAFSENLRYLPGTIKDAGGAWPYFSQKASHALGGLKAKISEMSTFSKFALGAGIAIAVGSAIASIINKATEAIDVGQHMSEEFKQECDEIASNIEDTKKDISDLNQKYKDIDTGFDTADETLEKLKQCIGANGEIKAGMEDQVRYLGDQFATAIGGRYEVEDGILKIYKDDNTELDLQKTKIDELMAKERLRAKLNAGRDDIEEAKKEIDFSLPEGERSKLVQDILDAKAQLDEAVEPDERQTAEAEYEAALKAYNARKAQIEAFEKAEEAYLDPTATIDDWNKASDTLNRGISEETDNMFAVANAIDDAKNRQQALNDAWAAGAITEEDFKSQLADVNAELELYESLLEKIAQKNPNEVLFTAGRLFGLDNLDLTKQEYAAYMYDIGEQTKIKDIDRAISEKPIRKYEDYLKSQFDGITEATLKNAYANKDKIQEEYKHIQDLIANTDWYSSSDITVLGTAINSLSNEAKAILEKDNPRVAKAFERVGEYTAAGFADGITGANEDLSDIMCESADAIIEAFAGELKIESPSKVMEELGEYTVLGFIEGIKTRMQDVEGAIQGLLQSATVIPSVVTAAMSSVNTGGATIGITPVINSASLAGVQNGIQNQLGQIDSEYYLRLLTDSQARILTDIETNLDITNIDRNVSTMTETLSDLQETVYELSEYITEIKVVMDTNALVGQLAAPMDTALGRRAALKRRGG